MMNAYGESPGTIFKWANNVEIVRTVATPNVNLVANIGFGKDAFHTTQKHWSANLPTKPLRNVTHPMVVSQDREADKFIFDNWLDGKYHRFPYPIILFPKRVLIFFWKRLKRLK